VIFCITHHHNFVQLLGVSRVVSLEDLNIQCTGRYFFIEDSLCIKSTIIIANTSVITTNDEVCAAVTLTEQ